MKIVLPIKKSIQLLKRSNLVAVNTVEDSLVDDVFTFIEAVFDCADQGDDTADVMELAIDDLYDKYNSYAYPKVLHSAIKDNKDLINLLSKLVPTFVRYTSIEYLNSTGGNRYLVLRVK